MAQYGRPSSDVAAGDWVSTPLYEKVDEVAADDGDLISATGSSHCELALNSLLEPGAGDVTVRVRYRKPSGGADSILTATLVEGTTAIASEQFQVNSETWTTGSFVLTAGEVASVTDWANLRIRLDYGDGAPAATQSLTYTEDTTTDFASPGRGWMTERQFTPSMYPTNLSIRNYYNQPVTVEFLYVDLIDYIGTDTIAASVLTALESSFSTARSGGQKVVLRFAYGRNSTNYCPALSRVLSHIGQLAPTVNANKDVMFLHQTGMYGPWGEQWNTGSGESWWDTATDRRQFIQKWLTELDDDIMVSVRYARDMVDFADATFAQQVLPVADRYLGGDQARFSLWSDSIVATSVWGDTWRSAQEQAYTEAQATYTPLGGESSDIGGLNSVNDGDASDTSFTTYQMDYLQTNFWEDIYDKWHSQGWLGTISRKLGYRLVLDQATVPVSVTPGTSMNVSLAISNSGYGKVINRRPLDLVFVGTGGPFTARMSADARRDLPSGGQTTTPTFTFDAPSGLQNGESYALHLRFPDPDSGLASNNGYAIRLANTGLWDGATGRHALGMSVTVGAAAAPSSTLVGEGRIVASVGSQAGSLDLRVASVADAAGLKAPSSWYTADPLYWTGSLVTQALRFQGVNIPPGATITSARLTVYSNANMGGATANDKVRVYGEDVNNASAIGSASDGVTRFANNITTANVDWYVWQANGPLTGENQPVQSPSITSIVQEIVNRAGWASGNAMLFFIEDLGTYDNSLAMKSYFNGASGTYPRLEVSWT